MSVVFWSSGSGQIYGIVATGEVFAGRRLSGGLDRIVPIRVKGDTTNHDEIFIERSEQLTSLKCHVIYTVPISMVYSGNASDLLARYGMVETLPNAGVEDIFAEGQALTDLCIMSGGSLRVLVHFMKMVMKDTPDLPIPTKVVKLVIAEMRDSYRQMILESQWDLLARVYLSQDIINDADYRKLFFNRFVLEYKMRDIVQYLRQS